MLVIGLHPLIFLNNINWSREPHLPQSIYHQLLHALSIICLVVSSYNRETGNDLMCAHENCSKFFKECLVLFSTTKERNKEKEQARSREEKYRKMKRHLETAITRFSLKSYCGNSCNWTKFVPGGTNICSRIFLGKICNA